MLQTRLGWLLTLIGCAVLARGHVGTSASRDRDATTSLRMASVDAAEATSTDAPRKTPLPDAMPPAGTLDACAVVPSRESRSSDGAPLLRWVAPGKHTGPRGPPL